MLTSRQPQKLQRSASLSQMHFNCFGSFDGLHNLLLGKFRFGLELKRSKSICEDGLMLSDKDNKIDHEIYLPHYLLNHFDDKSLRRTISYQDLTLVGGDNTADGSLLSIDYQAGKQTDNITKKQE